MTATYTYSDELISDHHKDALGHSPTDLFWEQWEGMTPARKQRQWDSLLQARDDPENHERKRKKVEAVAAFERWLRKVEDRHGTVENALRVMTESERCMRTKQDARRWVGEQGFLFTDRGREVVEMLWRIYKMES